MKQHHYKSSLCIIIIILLSFFSKAVRAQLSFKNVGANKAYVAIYYYVSNSDEWKTIGWFIFEPNQEKEIFSSIKNKYYYYFVDWSGSPKKKISANDYYGYITSGKFSYSGDFPSDQNDKKYIKVGFKQVDTGNETEMTVRFYQSKAIAYNNPENKSPAVKPNTAKYTSTQKQKADFETITKRIANDMNSGRGLLFSLLDSKTFEAETDNSTGNSSKSDNHIKVSTTVTNYNVFMLRENPQPMLIVPSNQKRNILSRCKKEGMCSLIDLVENDYPTSNTILATKVLGYPSNNLMGGNLWLIEVDFKNRERGWSTFEGLLLRPDIIELWKLYKANKTKAFEYSVNTRSHYQKTLQSNKAYQDKIYAREKASQAGEFYRDDIDRGNYDDAMEDAENYKSYKEQEKEAGERIKKYSQSSNSKTSISSSTNYDAYQFNSSSLQPFTSTELTVLKIILKSEYIDNPTRNDFYSQLTNKQRSQISNL